MLEHIIEGILIIGIFFMGMLMTVLVLKIAVIDPKNGRRCAAWMHRKLDKWEHTRHKRNYRKIHGYDAPDHSTRT